MQTNLNKTILDLWHISRTALVGTIPTRYDRMQYVKNAIKEHYPNLIEGLTPKRLWFAIEDAIN